VNHFTLHNDYSKRDTGYLLGIDPGSNFVGLAWLEVDVYCNVVSIDHFTIDLANPVYGVYPNTLNDRLRRLNGIIFDLCLDYNPFWLAIEAGFINRFRPAAYGPIAKSIFAIEDAFLSYLGMNKITEYPPSIVKRKIAQQGLANKDSMRDAIMSISEINRFINPTATEHEIDAIAIGYTKILEIRERPEIIYYH